MQKGMDFLRQLKGRLTPPLAEPLEQGALAAEEEPKAARIGRAQVGKAEATLKKYKDAKAALETRIVENEDWYQLRQWNRIKKSTNKADPEPASAWLFNCIANKHADAMDNYPQPGVLPREQSDKEVAEKLSSILPVVLEQNHFEQVYSDTWWYKLKAGTGVYGVFWNPRKENGLGDIDIRKVDLLNLFWEPGVADIQHSRELFHTELMDNDILLERYPQLKGKLGQSAFRVAEYAYGGKADMTEKSLVVDWYYKKAVGTKTLLHYCKFVGGEVLYASEDDPECAETGFYAHGQYPFVLDTLFPVEGMPTGFGYVDVCKNPQLYVDKMDQVILKNAVTSARQRYFVRLGGEINENEYADAEKEFVHYQGNGSPRDSVMPIETKTLPDIYVSIRNQKIEELKETSGNRDFSQGGTAQGVTAASAIAALQEAGSKLSRDMIKSSYRAFAKMNTLVIELMRQFYTEPRYFRILGQDGMASFESIGSGELGMQDQGEAFGVALGMRAPVFDISVTSQKSSPFSTVAQNERAKELYGMGFFNPQLSDQALAALDMMDFEGIDKVRQRVAQNGMLFQQLQQMQAQAAQLAMIVDRLTGSQIAEGLMAQAGGAGAAGGATAPSQGSEGEVETNVLGKPLGVGQDGTAARARVDAARAATPR